MFGKFDNRHTHVVPVLLSRPQAQNNADFHCKDRSNVIARTVTMAYDEIIHFVRYRGLSVKRIVWPWYSRIAPPSWLVVLDVFRGRRNLNFSEWGVAGGEREGGDMDEAIEQIQQGEMPPSNYLPLHPGAALSAAEKQQLIDGLHASGR